jgi:hypothetical protein
MLLDHISSKFNLFLAVSYVIKANFNIVLLSKKWDCLCGLVVKFLATDSEMPSSIPDA